MPYNRFFQIAFDKDAGGVTAEDGADVDENVDTSAPTEPAADDKGTQENVGKGDQGEDRPAEAADKDKEPEPSKGKAESGIIGDDEGDDDDTKVVHTDFPETWRKDWAGDDKALLKQLKRMKTPKDVLTSYRALQQKLSSGEYKRVLPEGASEEEVAEYREAEGIPKAPEDYTLPNVKEYEWNETDESIIGGLFEEFHTNNVPQKVVDSVLTKYADIVAQAQTEQADNDRAFKISAEEDLRVEFGTDYRAHMNIFKRTLEDDKILPGELGAILTTARTEDGSRLINHPDIAKFIIGLGLENYGEGGLLTGEERGRIDGSIEEIEKVMRTDIDRYRSEGLDKKLSALYAKRDGRKNK